MALHKSFALPPDELFDWIEEVPIACGSIGQVHRAQLSEKGAALACCDAGEVVAVKVREQQTPRRAVLWHARLQQRCATWAFLSETAVCVQCLKQQQLPAQVRRIHEKQCC